MGPIGILEKKAGGKEQQQRVYDLLCPSIQILLFSEWLSFKNPVFLLYFVRYFIHLDYSAEVLGGPTDFTTARILPLGSNCPLPCSCHSYGSPCEPPAPWSSSPRGNPHKSIGTV